jgi:hypothetical protein
MKYGTVDTITHEQRLMLIGLLALASDHRKFLSKLEDSVRSIIGEKDSGGRASDFVWGDEGSGDELLAREGITVVDA